MTSRLVLATLCLLAFAVAARADYVDDADDLSPPANASDYDGESAWNSVEDAREIAEPSPDRVQLEDSWPETQTAED